MSFWSALQPVQTAIYQALSNDSGFTALSTVYDHVPESTAYNYTAIVDLSETPDDELGDQGRIVTVTVMAFSQTPGFKGLQLITDNILRILSAEELQGPTPDQGWSIWYNRVTRSRMTRLADGKTRQATVTLEVGASREALGT